MKGRFENLVGKRFGKISILKKTNIGKMVYWFYKCDCGRQKLARSYNIQNKKSCGCERKHGLCSERFYHIFAGMKQRCYNPKQDAYKSYGKKGIKVLWGSFEEFRDDMFESYLDHVEKFGEKQTTIDRIDGRGNYSKENCRWATLKEQGENKLKRRILFKGKLRSPSQIGEITKIHFKINLLSLALDLPLSYEDKLSNIIFKLPINISKILDLRFNQQFTFEEISKKLGISKQAVHSSCIRGLNKIRALSTLDNMV